MEGRVALDEPSSRRTEKQVEIDKMRNALKSIAHEMQRYQDSDHQLNSSVLDSPDSNEGEKVLAELLKCKTKIKCKKHRIQKLRNNLKTACFVAKSLASAKEVESGCLKHNLHYAQGECADLKNKEKNNIQIISCLSRENNNLRDKLNRVSNFIRLGYKELQKIKNEFPEETSVLVQLKKLIVSCGEYYADYCNEHDKCLHLKQRNHFLQNKISFLEKSVKALSEQLKPFKCQYVVLQKDSDVRIRSDKSKPYNDNIEVKFAEVNMNNRENFYSITSNRDANVLYKKRHGEFKAKVKSEHDIELSPHLSTVKKLLNDQDSLLKDLKMLSQEFLNNNASDEFS